MKADVSIQLIDVPFDSPFEFAHETPAFVRKQPDYGAAGTNPANINQSWLVVLRLPSLTPSGVICLRRMA